MSLFQIGCKNCDDASTPRFLEADPFARFLVRRLSLNPTRMALLSATIQLATGIALRLSIGPDCFPPFSPLTAEARVRTLFGIFIFSFLLTPAIWAAYIWLPLDSERMFRELIHRGTIRESSTNLHEMLTPPGRIHRIFRNPLWGLACILIPTIAATLFFIGFTGPLEKMQSKAAWLSVLISMPSWWIGWYMVCRIAACQVSTILGLHVLFDGRRLTVHPLHPDRCGGLGPLNNYALHFAYILALFALALATMGIINAVARSIQGDPVAYFLITTYLLGAPLCFFGSLGLAHGPMKSSRDELLVRISNRFMTDYTALQSKLETEPEDLRSIREKVEELKKLHDLTAAFPVWPFNTANVRRFLAALAVPLLPIGIAVISGLIKKRLLLP